MKPLPEITVKAVVLGVLLTIILAAVNAVLGLVAGLAGPPPSSSRLVPPSRPHSKRWALMDSPAFSASRSSLRLSVSVTRIVTIDLRRLPGGSGGLPIFFLPAFFLTMGA